MAEPVANRAHGGDPEHEAVLADSVGLALLVVLETLEPAERLAFVLHDMFAMPFEEIAPIVGRSSAAARQLASRARRRVQGKPAIPEADLARQRQVVDAYLAAARGGDFDALVAVLDPDVVVRSDRRPIGPDGETEVRGAAAVAERALKGGARAASSRARQRRGRYRHRAARTPLDGSRPDDRGAARSPRSTRSRIRTTCGSLTWPCFRRRPVDAALTRHRRARRYCR